MLSQGANLLLEKGNPYATVILQRFQATFVGVRHLLAKISERAQTSLNVYACMRL